MNGVRSHAPLPAERALESKLHEGFNCNNLL